MCYDGTAAPWPGACILAALPRIMWPGGRGARLESCPGCVHVFWQRQTRRPPSVATADVKFYGRNMNDERLKGGVRMFHFQYENKNGVKYAVALYPTGLYGIMKRDSYGFTMVGVTGRSKTSWIGSREKMEKILANMATRYGWKKLEPPAE